MKTKTIYLLLFLILVLILFLFLKSRTQNQPPKTNPIPQPSVSQISTFQLISTSISGNSVGITEPIKLTFNQPVSDNILYTLRPQKEIRIRRAGDPNEIIVDPLDGWSFDTTYTLTILKTTSSATGETLDKNYTYSFKAPPYSGI